MIKCKHGWIFSVFQCWPVLRLPHDVTLSISGQGQALPYDEYHCDLSHAFMCEIVQKKTFLPSPIACLLGSVCVLYQSLFGWRCSSRRMLCKTTVWKQIKLLCLYYFKAPLKCSWSLLRMTGISVLFSVIKENIQLIRADNGLILNTTKTVHFPADYLHF